MAAPFKDVYEPLQIGIDIGVRVFQRISHPGLRGEVNDTIRLFISENACHRVFVFNRNTVKVKRLMPGDAGKPRILQRDIIIVVEIVNPDDIIAARKQALDTMHADEAGATCNQNFH
jgi:hypothetical protein